MQRKSTIETSAKFIDNRPEAVMQRKLQEMADNNPQSNQITQFQQLAANNIYPIQKKENKTGLPDNLKTGVENLSGYSMDDVKVHYNSSQPATLQAHAYAQGTNIHVASGQEKHLAHEAWHVIQQKQGRVKPTMQMKGGVNVNDDTRLEKEADVMGSKALQKMPDTSGIYQRQATTNSIVPSNQQTYQLATKITHTAGTVPFGGQSYLVGKKMTALLDPEDVVTGSATTADNYDWMKGIRAYYPAAGVIRGHLLNHDLGGYGVPENLYPISSIANSKHSNEVEQNVKGALSNSASGTKKIIKYEVDVREAGRSDIPYEKAAFVCNWTDEDGNDHNKTIESNLTTDSGWGGKSKSTLKSPSAWRHGKRRGEENMSVPVKKEKIVIDTSLMNPFEDYSALRSKTLDSKGISDTQDWEEALKMLENEILELASVADPSDPPKLLAQANKFLISIKSEVAKAKKSNTLAQLTRDRSGQMMNNLKATRAERLYIQDGLDTELNDGVLDMDMTGI